MVSKLAPSPAHADPVAHNQTAATAPATREPCEDLSFARMACLHLQGVDRAVSWIPGLDYGDFVQNRNETVMVNYPR
jgi:hypothetical protein